MEEGRGWGKMERIKEQAFAVLLARAMKVVASFSKTATTCLY